MDAPARRGLILRMSLGWAVGTTPAGSIPCPPA